MSDREFQVLLAVIGIAYPFVLQVAWDIIKWYLQNHGR